jgi:hypothetical protein
VVDGGVQREYDPVCADTFGRGGGDEPGPCPGVDDDVSGADPRVVEDRVADLGEVVGRPAQRRK